VSDKKVNFIIGIHCHQPVGNFGWVISEAYEKAYLPFIEVLRRHPRIKINLHLSGGLLEWIGKNKPEYFDYLRELIDKRQVELLGGGFYEPVLTLIPEKDRFLQLALLKDFIKKYFKYEVKGAWLAERVWEPHLVNTFNRAGIRYTIVDDTHFRLTGKNSGEIFGYYITEEDSEELFIFPTSQKLRYMIPFKLPQDTIEYLKSLLSQEDRAVVIADDGEKFGFWPGTYKWVYQEQYLENFFSVLEENGPWLNIMTFSEFIEQFKPLGRIYLPCASYTEMISWSQGYFKNFLVKYPESNILHKKMLYVSNKLNSLKGKAGGDKNESLITARNLLYMGQCNDAYWHGVFGGFYLNHLRETAFRSLIESEKIVDSLSKKKKDWLDIEVFDFDKDGCDDIIVNTPLLNLYVSPNMGGEIFEIDFKPKSLNMLNALARRYELYHDKIKNSSPTDYLDKSSNSQGVLSIHDIVGFKEGNLETYLAYDRYRKIALIDHFFGEEATVREFSKSKVLERGDFVEKPFTFEIKKSTKKVKEKTCTILLSRRGNVRILESEIPVEVKKSIFINSTESTMSFKYAVQNLSRMCLRINFGVEFNLSLKEPQFNGIGEIENINKIELNDVWHNLNVNYELTPKCSIWYFPIETISGSESGIERTYQGLCLLFLWHIELAGSEKDSFDIKATFL